MYQRNVKVAYDTINYKLKDFLYGLLCVKGKTLEYKATINRSERNVIERDVRVLGIKFVYITKWNAYLSASKIYFPSWMVVCSVGFVDLRMCLSALL